MLNKSILYLLYCYLVCLITLLYSIFKIANLSSDWLKATYFDIEINVPYHLERHVYLIDKQERNVGLSIEQLEERRQEALVQYAQTEPKRLKMNVFLDLPYLFIVLATLGVHVGFLFLHKKKD
jgi:hypothetical protein